MSKQSDAAIASPGEKKKKKMPEYCHEEAAIHRIEIPGKSAGGGFNKPGLGLVSTYVDIPIARCRKRI